MRDIHKWKDKVELSLDNRQIFFLFFGLSIVGCFVFALGVMVGRRVDFDTVAQADAEPAAGLALLDVPPGEPTSYDAGLRDDAAVSPLATPPVAIAPELDAAPALPGAASSSVAKSAGKSTAGKADKAATGDKAEPAAAKADDATLAASSSAVAGRRFTLQMKAFAKAEEAEAFAAPLRSNGHDVRVEAHEIKGRVWHRVRMGEFDTWEEGLTAKGDFEKSEKMIAYVVRL